MYNSAKNYDSEPKLLEFDQICYLITQKRPTLPSFNLTQLVMTYYDLATLLKQIHVTQPKIKILGIELKLFEYDQIGYLINLLKQIHITWPHIKILSSPTLPNCP